MNTISSIRKYALLMLISEAFLPLSNLSAVVIPNPNGLEGDSFGVYVGSWGNTAIIGANGNNSNTGAAYLFNATTGEQTQTLTASDGATDDYFGGAVGISGNTAIVGAYGSNSNTGAAYLFDATTGTETFKLTASDGVANDWFGYSSGISGNTAIVGAWGNNSYTGAAYLFDATTGEQTFKLTASDRAADDGFGWSVGISGNTAIVGARMKDNETGAAYIFDATTGTQTLKLTASVRDIFDSFGVSVSIDGDSFVIGANAWPNDNYIGKAFSGSVSSMTTLDDGSSKVISGISFESSVDWIIGEYTSGNTVTLGASDSVVIAGDKALYIGKNAGSNNNTLILAGGAGVRDFGLDIREIYVGSLDGNSGNLFQTESTNAPSYIESIYLATNNAIAFEIPWSMEADIFVFLGDIELFISQDSISWTTVTIDNYLDLIADGFLSITTTASGGMLVTAVPEPAEVAALFGLLALGFVAYRRRSAALQK